MLQCYRCRCEVAPPAIRHRMLNAGSAARKKGFASRYRKVVLCPRCATLHDYWQKVRSRVWIAVAGVAAAA